MTVPYERTRAVFAAAEFLRRLASPYGANAIKKIPAEVRAEARRLLRHYPHPYDLHAAATAAPEVFSVQAGYDLPESAQCPP